MRLLSAGLGPFCLLLGLVGCQKRPSSGVVDTITECDRAVDHLAALGCFGSDWDRTEDTAGCEGAAAVTRCHYAWAAKYACEANAPTCGACDYASHALFRCQTAPH